MYKKTLLALVGITSLAHGAESLTPPDSPEPGGRAGRRPSGFTLAPVDTGLRFYRVPRSASADAALHAQAAQPTVLALLQQADAHAALLAALAQTPKTGTSSQSPHE